MIIPKNKQMNIMHLHTLENTTHTHTHQHTHTQLIKFQSLVSKKKLPIN